MGGNLILMRAFKTCMEQSIAQPRAKPVERTAIAYRNRSRDVHQKITKLVPPPNVFLPFRTEKIHVGLSALVKGPKDEFVDGVRSGVVPQVNPPKYRRQPAFRLEVADVQLRR